MDTGGSLRPKRVDERYEALAGVFEERVLIYLFKRKLDIGYAEMKALPWWLYEVYVEGLMWENDPEGHRPRGEAKLDDLGAQGFSVQRGGG